MKYIRISLLVSFVCMLTFQVKAQAPVDIKGVAITVSIKNGVSPWFASKGEWIGLPSAVNNNFALVPITTNISPTFGTYTYSKTSEKIGIISVYNQLEDYHSTVMMVFSSQNTGTIKLLLDDNPNIFQEGTFLIKKSNSPKKIVGKKGIFTITHGSGIYGENGVWEWIPSADGSYVVNTISGDVSDSDGIFQYIKISDSTAKITYTNSEVGIGSTMQMTFDSQDTGIVFLKGPKSEDYQTCIFILHDLSAIPEITKQPIDATAKLGGMAEFRVEAKTKGNIPLSYQWYHEIPMEYQLTAVLKGDGIYLELSIPYSRLPNYSIGERYKPSDFGITIAGQPVSDDYGEIHIIEKKHEEPYLIPEAVKSTLQIENITKVDFGEYFVKVTNPSGSVKSEIANLDLYRHPNYLWEFETGGGVISSPAIGSDGSVYFGSLDYDNNYLYAINPDGSKKWDTSDVLFPITLPPPRGSPM